MKVAMSKFIQRISFFAAASLSIISPLHAAPSPDMVGKSYLVSWTESRTGRVNGSDIKSTSVSYQLQIYVGATGRPFTRLTSSSRGGTSSNEQVGGSGESLGGGVRTVRADGNTITLQANYGNFARSGRIDVSPGGSGCSAQMSVGKEPGSSPKPYRNAAGNLIEIHTVSVSSTSCSVQQGNVFGR